ncbi:MAG: hypothetical protein NC410_02685 [Oscillibacter sp.]|nr:hypothetical protein [Oscillibacter sp.]
MGLTPKTIIVCHSEDSTTPAPEGGSWLEYWEKESCYPIPKVCVCCGNFSNDMVGSHLVDNEGNTYIYPVCRKCNSTYKNSNNKKFEIPKIALVPIASNN